MNIIEMINSKKVEGSNEPIKMRLQPSNGFGFDLDQRLELVESKSRAKIDVLEKKFIDDIRSQLHDLELAILDRTLREIDHVLDVKKEAFFANVVSGASADHVRASIASVQKAITGFEIEGYDGSVEKTKDQIVEALKQIEIQVSSSVERIKPRLKEVEVNSISKLEGQICSALSGLEKDLEIVIERKRQKLLSQITSIDESTRLAIDKIKSSINPFEKGLIQKFIDSSEETIVKKRNEFIKSIGKVEESLRDSADRTKVGIDNLEKVSIEKVKIIIDDYIDEKKQALLYKVAQAEDVAYQHMEKVRTILDAVERTIFEKTAAAIEGVLENKKSKFLAGIWVGTDIGSVESPLRNVYSKGEAVGLRLENCEKTPESSGASVGRLSYSKKDENVYIDCGWGSKKVSSNRVSRNILWPKGLKKLEIDLSDETIQDAREVIWQLCDNENGYERVHCRFSTPEKNKLTIEVDTPLAPSAYRILGVE